MSQNIQKGLGGPSGYGEFEVPRSDDAALAVDLSAVFENGLMYFGTSYGADALHVNTNGTVSFGGALASYPTADNIAIQQDFIAPFWGDVDTRLDGEGAESGAIWVDIDPLQDMVTVTWDAVGVYRRNAEVFNTFQLQLIDRGGTDFDIVFRYEHIGWTLGSSTLDSGARAGLAAAGLPEPDWLDIDLHTLPGAIGNTGTAGLWLYQMRQGVLVDYVPVPEPDPGPQPPVGVTLHGTPDNDLIDGTTYDDILTGSGGNDTLDGGSGHDSLYGGPGNDLLHGGTGDDSLQGGDGADTIIGEGGDDFIFGGDSAADLSDRIFGGDGNDTIDGGYGNDILRGDGGQDAITGGFGSDTIIGADGDDILSGQALSDLIYGGPGDDFLNGGFGHDRLNGGPGADRFFHLGVTDHGSDWIQDYEALDGDVLVFARNASIDDFQVNLGETPNAGTAGVAEAFVIYKETGRILWALVDGAAQDQIILSLGGTEYDLLA